MIEEAVSAVAEAAVAAGVFPADQEKCTRQLVLTANRKLKYLLYHQATDPFIVGNATQSINQRDIK
jgi:hypothetical protein